MLVPNSFSLDFVTEFYFFSNVKYLKKYDSFLLCNYFYYLCYSYCILATIKVYVFTKLIYFLSNFLN